MKALKIILIVIGVLIAAYLIMCAVGPSQFNVSRTMTVGAPASAAYQQVSNLQNWENWSPWYGKDTTMDVTYGETKQGVGGSYSWTSNDMGSGSLEVVEAEPNNSMRTKLQFEGWDGHSYGIWKFEETGDSTDVTWGIESSEIPFFMRGSMLLMDFDATMGKDFEEGLSNLKEYVEEQAALPTEYRGFIIKKTTYPGMVYAGVRDRINFEQMEGFYESSYLKIMEAAASQQVSPSGPAAGLYYEWDEENSETEMVAAFPFENAPNEVGDIEIITVPASSALLIDYYGNYEGLGEAHYAMDDYIKARNMEIGAPVIESYITGPSQEPDTSKWLTQIWYLSAEK